MEVYNFVHNNAAVILGALLGLSELLALIPGVKANSIFELVYNFLKKEETPAAK